MRTGTTRREQGRTGGLVLHVAFELDDFHWTLTMGTGMRREPRSLDRCGHIEGPVREPGFAGCA